jgi:microcystin-dependent protein
MPYAGSTAPTDWLLCYGQAISRTTYADLFAVVSTTYGAGDGSTTFNLPDLRGRVVAGEDDMGGTSANRLTNQSGGVDGDVLGAAGGSETHTLTTAQLASHTHGQWNSVTNHGAFSGGATSAGTSATGGTTGSAGSGSAHNNVQPTIILNYIIKT